MSHAALGVRMHSGWGVLVAVSGDAGSIEIVDRRRIAVTDTAIAGGNQPYHYAAKLDFPAAERHLANSASASERLALAAVGDVIQELDARRYRIVGCAVLQASGKPLPPLAKILAAHPLIHTAEGEFFRDAVRWACERLKIPVSAVRARDLDALAKTAFGNTASGVQRRIASLGKSVGPPWTADHKAAALGAAMVLASHYSSTKR